jgi:hypothetical protein
MAQTFLPQNWPEHSDYIYKLPAYEWIFGRPLKMYELYMKVRAIIFLNRLQN